MHVSKINNISRFVVFKKYLGYVFTIISIFLLAVMFFENKNVISFPKLTVDILLVLIYSVIIVIVGHFILTFCWYIQLVNKYNAIYFNKLFIAIGLSQIAKYMPGNIAHLLGRALLIKDEIETKDVGLTLVVESVLIFISAILFCILWALNYTFPESIKENIDNILCLIVLFFIVFFITTEVIKNKFKNRIICYRSILIILPVNCVSFILHGTAIYFISNIIYGIASVSIEQFVYGFAMSFIIGYILPGAPGGVGVREYAFVTLFDSYINSIEAFEIITLYRLVTILGDCLTYVIALIFQRKFRLQGV